MSDKKDVRKHRRIPYLGPINVVWEGIDGQPRYASVKCIDISESGLRIELPEPVPVRSSISLRAERINLAGSATVKHVTPHGRKYLLGIQLSQKLKEQVLSAIEGRPHVTLLMENFRKLHI